MPPRIPEEDVIASQGACANTQDRAWTDLSPQMQGENIRAKGVCSRCPVQDECRTVIDYLRDAAPDPRWLAGIWAGEGPGEQERRRKGK
jgi:hypothetical protein